jgi:hypothetical protein
MQKTFKCLHINITKEFREREVQKGVILAVVKR